MADNEHDVATLPDKKREPGKSSTFDVGPSHLDFGTQGHTSAKLQVLLTNNGDHKLTWKASVTHKAGKTEWLELGQTFGNQTSGTIQAHAQQVIDVTADASDLEDGQYHATLHFTSNAVNTDVPVSLNVFSKRVGIVENHGGPKILNRTPLNFGSLNKGSKKIAHVTIANLNTSPLFWNANIQNETSPGGWLQLGQIKNPIPASGSVTLDVTLITTKLTPGSYSAQLVVASNLDGDQAPISVTIH